jgi:hypothetical protein
LEDEMLQEEGEKSSSVMSDAWRNNPSFNLILQFQSFQLIPCTSEMNSPTNHEQSKNDYSKLPHFL